MKLWSCPRTVTRAKVQVEQGIICHAMVEPGWKTRLFRSWNTLLPQGDTALQLTGEDALAYLTKSCPDYYGWTEEEATIVLSNLNVGDEMIPDERFSCDERIVRIS